MTAVVFERVVSYSSEDPKFPARNLLHFGKPWKCAAGATNATVILQLDEPRAIESVDIGNDHSAFVHVLVGRAAIDEFQTLLPASSFMTAEESARGECTSRVRMFTKSDFVEPTASDKWDRIKIVCSQPFNRKVQFGLAFFVARRAEEPGDRKSPEGPPPRPRPTPAASAISPSAAPALGHFTLKKNDDDDVLVGSLFARYRANGNEGSSSRLFGDLPEVPSEPSEDEDKAVPSRPSRPAPPPALGSPPPAKKGKVADRTNKPAKAGKVKAEKEEKPKPSAVKVKTEGAAKKVKVEKTDQTAAVKTEVKAERKPQPQQQQQQQPSKPCKPFSRLLEGVVFAMSGYVNPLRASLREQALGMGAKYRPDWDSSCTHLICAFKNTPKFRQVQGHGRIVQKDWVQQCHSKRKRLPWRRFALDINDFKQPESEEEIVEEVPGSAPGPSGAVTVTTTFTISNRGRGAEEKGEEEEEVKEEEEDEEERDRRASPWRAESGSDTEEEIERLKTKAAAASPAYQWDTDEDDDRRKRPITAHLPLPPLPLPQGSPRSEYSLEL